jgi:vacuolar-type H+-ATPase subunit I/STV1
MSLILFFGGVSIVIMVGLGVVIHGYRHHYLEAQKKNAEKDGAS